MIYSNDIKVVSDILMNGGIAVVRTDTLYGILARASDERAVEKVYAIKKRNPAKQMIVLITNETAQRQTRYSGDIVAIEAKYEDPTTVIVPTTSEPQWLLRKGDSMAYRIVQDDFLKQLIDIVGPVVAPSANPESQPPAGSIQEARLYFGESVDCYVDGGIVPVTAHASRIIKIYADGSTIRLR